MELPSVTVYELEARAGWPQADGRVQRSSPEAV